MNYQNTIEMTTLETRKLDNRSRLINVMEGYMGCDYIQFKSSIKLVHVSLHISSKKVINIPIFYHKPITIVLIAKPPYWMVCLVLLIKNTKSWLQLIFVTHEKTLIRNVINDIINSYLSIYFKILFNWYPYCNCPVTSW